MTTETTPTTRTDAVLTDETLTNIAGLAQTAIDRANYHGLPSDLAIAMYANELLNVIASHRTLTTRLAERDATVARLTEALRLIRGVAYHDSEQPDIAARLHSIANTALWPIETGEPYPGSDASEGGVDRE